MIKIKVVKEKDKILEISLTGHSLYDEYGKDIVCASVSSLVLCTVNGILDIEDTIEVTNNDIFLIKVVKYSDITNKLLINMLKCLESLEKEYPKNVKII